MNNKLTQYNRIKNQLIPLFQKVKDPISQMASIATLLHHKNSNFYWTGFYRLVEGRLLVGPYQGTLACMELKKDTGVCWHCINTGTSVIVPDVHAFAGHIACDSRSNSEIVVPLIHSDGTIRGVLDVDSLDYNSFDDDDRIGLESIVALCNEL